jgi:excinuclease ABC subunit C
MDMNLLDQKIDRLPDNPGVYLFKDQKGTVLYVGKAGNLAHRVGSYFQKANGKDTKTLTLLEHVADVETIITDTEKEALILENNLIKEHRPRYNVKLRDDKNYPCLKLSIEDEYPTLCIVRQIKKDRSLYFGPYTSATSLRETLKLIRRLFPIRTCLDTKFTHRLRPCINYEMGRCSGPCCDKIDPVQYREIVQQVRLFLEGKNEALIDGLRRRMEEESERLNFEAAAKIRDQIAHIDRVVEKQKIVSTDFIDQDVIGLHRQDHTIVVHPLFIRAGKLLGGRGFTFPSVTLPEEEVLASFLHQYYREGKFIPDRILLPASVPDQRLMEEWFTDLKGKKVRILVPQRGEKKRLLDLACQNAEKFLRTEAEVEQDRETLLELLKEDLHLTRLPRRIEAFDMSNLQGRHAVGSMVVFENGKAANERYRHYKIKSIEGADDYGMMYEVLLRRYTRALEENDLPDLVLVDGGKGQMNIAQEVFKELHIRGVDLVSLAKERPAEGAGTRKPGSFGEKVFHPQFRGPFTLGKHSPLIHFLDRIRDEAHRFAITYHKKVRSKGTIKSALGDIPGIGRVRQRALLKHFGSLDKVGEATLEELAGAPKMNSMAVRKVYGFFHPDE